MENLKNYVFSVHPRGGQGVRHGFTLAEMVAVIVIISLLAGVVTPQVVRSIQRGRDSRRISDINALATALQTYYMDHGQYPPNTYNNHGGWDCTCSGTFIAPLVDGDYLASMPQDPLNRTASGVSSHTTTSGSYFYNYHRYNAGSSGMPSERGNFAVIGARSLEVLNPDTFDTTTITGVTRNWGGEFSYYAILFEN